MLFCVTHCTVLYLSYRQVPPNHIHPITSSLALKVRPFYESSSDDHRAAAISIYSCLARCSLMVNIRPAILIMHRQSWFLSSLHLPTRQACLDTLTSLARVIQFQPLINSLSYYTPAQGFPALVSKIVSCGALIEMYPTAVVNAISYIKVQTQC